MELAAEKAQRREDSLAQELAQREEKTRKELEKARAEANHYLIENKALRRFADVFQNESILPEDTPNIALLTETHCENCAELMHHLAQVKQVNLSPAMKLKEYRFVVVNKAQQIKRCQYWAEGRPEETEIEVQELVKILEKEMADMKAANFDLVDQVTEQVKEFEEAKARAELEVDRLSKLCAFKDNLITSFRADIERVDSL